MTTGKWLRKKHSCFHQSLSRVVTKPDDREGGIFDFLLNITTRPMTTFMDFFCMPSTHSLNSLSSTAKIVLHYSLT